MRSIGAYDVARLLGGSEPPAERRGHQHEVIRAWYDDMGEPAAYDQSNEVALLRGMRDALVPKLPASQRVELEERLRAAIDAENYELAAILRDVTVAQRFGSVIILDIRREVGL